MVFAKEWAKKEGRGDCAMAAWERFKSVISEAVDVIREMEERHKLIIIFNIVWPWSFDDVFQSEDGDEREGESDGDDKRIFNRFLLFDFPEKEGEKTIDSKDDSRPDEESWDLESIIENVVSIDES